MVVIIIGILAAIAIPTFLAQRDRAEAAKVESDLRNAGTAYQPCITDENTFAECDSVTDLDPYGLNPSADVTFDSFAQAGATENVTITATHEEDATGTFTSANGQVNVTS